MTKEQMIDEIVQYSGGAFNMHVPDGFEDLSQAQQDEIMNEVYKEVDYCACCGWVWWLDYMDEQEGELWCNECIENEEQ